ncbi:DNA-binding protein Fis [Buchnera aphidicola (Neophyllaphis podocarpi)]|uniref:DNA-binding transcriptional regulator Fis n=1 Tax=Buchnera aphidicola TaxID=9 RepID=UPI0031B82C48
MFLNNINSNFVVLVPTININNKIVEKPLRNVISIALKNFFSNLNHSNLKNIYNYFLNEVEQPLLDVIMQHTRGNQTKAASLMGINRGTLRKKLKKYGMN